ncbi:M61 family metallopeptidase [Caulobacter mirabilis]|uniref:Peptidase M61 n=1 Tax=Caulobacter mirabilis TaxID=69666 RepID=A0A2D2AU01_9CAUL|nr:M61 family metallopeptidase [Caulobacter mirabilis]ATQ41476.1 peptidase M61 [Caulobacter mirabilis]
MPRVHVSRSPGVLILFKRSASALVLAWLLAAPAVAQPSPGPQPLPMPPAIPQAQDAPYPGTLKLTVDATDLDRRIFRVKQTIPVEKAGPLTLLYPEWLPGKHAPRGELEKVSGLKITAGGKTLPWTRDVVRVFAYHVDVPQGAKEIQVEFEFLSATAPDQGRVVVTQEMLNLQWNSTAFYPAGWYTRQIPIEATVVLPEGWKFGVALDVASQNGSTTTFKPVSFETLADSPMFAGKYYRQVDLDPGGRSPVKLNVVADRADLLEMTDEQVQKHRNLVVQADRLFGARHFDRYDFLLSLTDRMGGIGLEHHRSSENGVEPEYFTDWGRMASERDLLPHEYTHSWNGKFRRGADAWTPDYATPMRNSLLWVYEGQTQYWGYMLSARSGLWTKDEALGALAGVAATYDYRVGREWRDTFDTTNDPVISARKPKGWLSWQRNEDYYSEGLLVWLDVDTLIRERTGGKKSLDDFAKAFFGIKDGAWTVETYQVEDVVAALNSVTPYDWAGFLKARLASADKAPLDGFTRGGYRLVFKDTPNGYLKGADALSKRTDLTYSIGLALNATGTITGVQWEGPAFKAGLTVSNQIISVNGEAYSGERIRDAVKATKGGAPLELIVKAGEKFKVVKIDWTGGLRYPHLERVAGTPDRLGDILTPRGK